MALGRYKPEIKPVCENSNSTLNWKMVKTRGIIDKIRVEEDVSLKNSHFLKSVKENVWYLL